MTNAEMDARYRGQVTALRRERAVLRQRLRRAIQLLAAMRELYADVKPLSEDFAKPYRVARDFVAKARREGWGQ